MNEIRSPIVGTYVPIQALIHPVTTGEEYDGRLQINNTSFFFTLIYANPARSCYARLPRTMEEVRAEYQLKLTSWDGPLVDLDDREYFMFLSILEPLIESLEKLIQPEDFIRQNELGESEKPSTLAVQANLSIFFGADVCEIFNQPKFNCNIILI